MFCSIGNRKRTFLVVLGLLGMAFGGPAASSPGRWRSAARRPISGCPA